MPYWTLAALLLVPTLLALAWNMWAAINEPGATPSPEERLAATVWMVGALLVASSVLASLIT